MIGGTRRESSGFLVSLVGLVGLCGFFLVGCSSARPILAPNQHFKSVGAEAAESDVEECRKMAEAAGADEGAGGAGKVAGQTVVGAGVGAASGAVGGAVVGAAGSGSAIGAASGAVAGLLTGLIHLATGPSQADQTYQNFVNVCLKEKGYEVVGWK
jgi:hypothetical protein